MSLYENPCLRVGWLETLDHGVVLGIEGLQVGGFSFGCGGNDGVGQSDTT